MPAPVRPLRERDVVLLDAGGTLITLDYDLIRRALAPSGNAPGDEALDRGEVAARRWADTGVRHRLTARELWDGYFGRILGAAGVPEPAVAPAIDALFSANREHGLWRRPIAGAREVLARLAAAGRRMAVVSNAEGQVEADLREAGFGEFLETVVDSHLVGVAKPDPRIFEICLGRIGVTDRERCVHVGDVPAFDVAGARAAGISPVLIDAHDVYGDVDAVRIRSLGELPELLGV